MQKCRHKLPGATTIALWGPSFRSILSIKFSLQTALDSHKSLQAEFTINSKRTKPHKIHFRSKIKTKAKQDRLWSVLGKWENASTVIQDVTKTLNFFKKSYIITESICKEDPELASHRMKYICVALQVSIFIIIIRPELSFGKDPQKKTPFLFHLGIAQIGDRARPKLV